MRRIARLAAVAVPAILFATPAPAATLMVGAGRIYATPAAAARAARAGDTVMIAPGTYQDCAVWKVAHLTIEGEGPGVVLSDRICGGKAIFVIRGDGATVRNLTFAQARSDDGNGAGIRVEGADLTVDKCAFIDDQDGILAVADATSTLLVRDSTFTHDGACERGQGCAHGIYANRIALLRVLHSRFSGTQAGHHIKSRALRTEIADSRIEDGQEGTSSYLVDIPNGGALVMTGNTLEKGPHTQNPTTAVSVGEEGVDRPMGEIVLRQNIFTNDGPATTFVKNLTPAPARLIGNVLKGIRITPLTGAGTVR